MSPDELNARAEAAALYERYSARIHRFCVRRLGDRDEAADAVQDTFLRAWLALRDGAEVRFPVPWLLTIAENVCVSRFRARLARVTTTELSERSRVGYADPVSEVAGLATALRALPDRQRQALLRREVQGYSYDEIGEELGVSRASVAALIHRARHTVADRLRDARREVAALVPIPAVLRAPFEHGAVASFAATGVAAVAIAVPQLAAPPSASSSPPSAAMGEPALMVGADHVLTARTSLQRAAAAKRVARIATVTTSGSTALSGPATANAVDGGVVFVAEFPPLTPTADDAPDPRSEPSDEPTAPTAHNGDGPAAEAQKPEEPASSSAPESEPAPNADEPESEGGAPKKERRVPSAIRPGQEPKGEQGRSALAPGQVLEKAKGSEGSGEDSDDAKPAKQKQENADPPHLGGTAAEQPSAPAAPPAETTASLDPVTEDAPAGPARANEGQHAGADNGKGSLGDA